MIIIEFICHGSTWIQEHVFSDQRDFDLWFEEHHKKFSWSKVHQEIVLH